MEMLSHSSIESSHNQTGMLCGGEMSTWLESLESFEEPEDDYFKIDDYPLKRRQRRERLHSLHCYVARSGVVAIAASASMLTSQVENMTRADSHLSQQEDSAGTDGFVAYFFAIFVNLWRSVVCAVGGVTARTGELVTSLANAIGEPPHRPMQGTHGEQDAPLLLFWAINLCAFFTIASIFLFIFTFWANPVGSTELEEAEAVDQIQLSPQSPLLNNTGGVEPATAEGKKLEGMFRVLGVVSLSLISGCGLGLRHPVQSALLCGY